MISGLIRAWTGRFAFPAGLIGARRSAQQAGRERRLAQPVSNTPGYSEIAFVCLANEKAKHMLESGDEHNVLFYQE